MVYIVRQNEPVDGKTFAALVMTQVRQAASEILLDAPVLEFDAFGQALLSELEYACQRGLRVCCLLDATGSQHFIANHPALFAELQTRFRIHAAPDTRLCRIVFDRAVAVTGNLLLCDASLAGTATSVLITGSSVSALADEFWVAWAGAAVYPG